MQTHTTAYSRPEAATTAAALDALEVSSRAQGRLTAAARRTGPVLRELPPESTLALDLRAAHEALDDPRTAEERVLDAIVDRLWREVIQ